MTPASATGDALLERITSGPSLLGSLHAAAALRPEHPDALFETFERGDTLARLLLLPALAREPEPTAGALLRAALEGPDAAEREHAAWALGDRAPLLDAVPALEAQHAAGGFGGMLAELTLERWFAPGERRPVTTREPGPLRIVQVFMQGFLDAGLSRAGAGDGGGLATLLVHLSAALAARPEVERVTTLTRGFTGDGIPAIHGERSDRVAAGASIERIHFGGDGYLATADMWPHRRELERALEEALLRLAPVDAVHLRFADVATLAAARVCERLGLPVYFTLAPDPHALIRHRELVGALNRRSFVTADQAEHLLFRARLVERMRDQARGLALLPRASARAQLEELVRLPADEHADRVRIVAEGVSIASIDRTAPGSAAVRDLTSRIAGLPAQRRGLPLILSVGRLNRVKGFAALLEAWAGDRALRDAFNLVIVGGDLERPTAEEQVVLGQISVAAGRHPAASGGLLLLGHRPHRDVIALLAAAREGVAGTIGAGGVYACASEKEEFGLALLEAMATGLSVLGPALGGPPTFIADGVTGTIADTATVTGLRAGLRRAVAARLDPERAAGARATVRERFTVDAMAAGLVDLYRLP